MAKYKSRRPRSSGNSSGIGKIIAGVLALAILVGAACATGYASRNDDGKWFKNSNIATWHWKDKTTEDKKDGQAWGGVIDDEGYELDGEEVNDMPVAMAFYSAYPVEIASTMDDPVIKVTCLHNFKYNNVMVDWSVEYKNGLSAENVINVTPKDEGSVVANITCLSAFSEPITLKATEQGNPENFATCQIDYIKRVESFTSFSLGATDYGDQQKISVGINFGKGTIEPTVDLEVCNYLIYSEFQAEVTKRLTFNIRFKNAFFNNVRLNKSNGNEYTSAVLGQWDYSSFITDERGISLDSFDTDHLNAIYYAWWHAWDNYKSELSNIQINSFRLSFKYNGKEIETFSGKSSADDERFTSKFTGKLKGKDLSPNLTLNDVVI